MKKYLVETYYTCTFKTVHSLNELNEKSMSEIDKRERWRSEVIEVKLNNRTKQKLEIVTSESNKNKEEIKVIGKKHRTKSKKYGQNNNEIQNKIKTKIGSRFKNA